MGFISEGKIGSADQSVDFSVANSLVGGEDLVGLKTSPELEWAREVEKGAGPEAGEPWGSRDSRGALVPFLPPGSCLVWTSQAVNLIFFLSHKGGLPCSRLSLTVCLLWCTSAPPASHSG